MFQSDIILPPQFSRHIFNASFLCFLSGIVAIYREYYDLAFVPLSVGFTSVIYWIHPDMSWRRTVDISVVQIGLMYQIYRAWNAEHMLLYYSFTGTGILCFIPGVFLFKQKHYCTSTICHCLLHIFANIGNVLLYLGDVP